MYSPKPAWEIVQETVKILNPKNDGLPFLLRDSITGSCSLMFQDLQCSHGARNRRIQGIHWNPDPQQLWDIRIYILNISTRHIANPNAQALAPLQKKEESFNLQFKGHESCRINRKMHLPITSKVAPYGTAEQIFHNDLRVACPSKPSTGAFMAPHCQPKISERHGKKMPKLKRNGL